MSSMVGLLTLLFAAIAAVGSVVRVAQNERSYKLMRENHTVETKKTKDIPIGYHKER